MEAKIVPPQISESVVVLTLTLEEAYILRTLSYLDFSISNWLRADGFSNESATKVKVLLRSLFDTLNNCGLK